MPIFQPGGDNAGYRGPAKTLTIKALQDRQKALQASSEAAAANAAPITNMWQGAGALVNSLGDSMQMSRAASQEGDARAQLAGIMAGIDPSKGASMEQIAAMQQLDPEFANAEYTRAMAERAKIADREDTQTFQAGESQADRDARAAEQQATFGQQDKTAKTLVGTNEAAAVSADARADENASDAAAYTEKQARINAALQTSQAQRAAQVADGSMSPEEADQLNQMEIEKLNAEISKEKVGTEFADIKTAGELGIGGVDPGTPYQQDVNTNEWKPVNSGGGTSITTNVGGGKKLDETLDVEEGKIWTGIQKSRNTAAAASGDFKILGELVKLAPQGPITGNLMSLPILKNFSNAGQAFNSIIKRVAPTMRVEGTGSTSDLEYNGMLDSLPALGNYPEANSMIIGMMQAKAKIDMERGAVVDAYRNGKISDIQAREQLQEIGSRSITPPELQALIATLNAGETPAAADPAAAAAPAAGAPDVDAILKGIP